MTNESLNDRAELYRGLHGQLRREEEQTRLSARVILQELFRHFVPRSVLDVGCGIGTWLATAQELGIADILGIEGDWLDRSAASIPREKIIHVELERAFDLQRRFDLVICLEVAEHLHAQSAARFVESLVRHADVILFSAAIPFQMGHHHVNEQFLDYWAKLFEGLGYKAVDCIRPKIWENAAVLSWLRQNIVVFARHELTTGSACFARFSEGQGPLSIVHPELYLLRAREAASANRELRELLALLASGDSFSLVRHPNGQVTITRKEY